MCSFFARVNAFETGPVIDCLFDDVLMERHSMNIQLKFISFVIVFFKVSIFEVFSSRKAQHHEVILPDSFLLCLFQFMLTDVVLFKCKNNQNAILNIQI